MLSINEAMKHRRSIRRYKQEPINDRMLQQILEAVQSSPSWTNSQCWELVIIDAPEIRKATQQAVPTQNPAYNAIVNAPLLVAICAKIKISGYINGEQASKFGDWFMYDLGLATQNLCLCAHEMGLGSVIVGWFDHDKVKKVIALPDVYKVVTLIPIGQPGHKGSSPQRKQLGDFVHNDQFGTALTRG